MSYATGHKAWGECGRCGSRQLLNRLRLDGNTENLLVCRTCWEPRYPLETLTPLEDPIAVARPAPRNDKVKEEVRFPNYNLYANSVNGTLAIKYHIGTPTVSVT